MSFQVVSAHQVPHENITQDARTVSDSSQIAYATKAAMRRLDRFATESGYGWKKALMVAGKTEGQTKHLNSGQVERVIREIKRRMKG